MTNLEKALLVEGFEAEEDPYSPGKIDCKSVHPDAWGIFNVSKIVPGEILAGGYWYELCSSGVCHQEYWAIDSNHVCWNKSMQNGKFHPLDAKDLIVRCMAEVNDPEEHD